MHKLSLFTVIVLIWRVAAEDAKPSSRHKRILNGLEAPDRDSGFAVSRYMVWISDQHICTGGLDKERLTVACDVDYRHQRCGGALLTATIVQTAGHCISTMQDFRRLEEPSPCVRYNPYVDLDSVYFVFVGWNTVKEFEIGYGPEQYVLNQKCANLNLRNVSYYFPFPIVHDYALIILKTPVDPYKDFQFQKSNYAPTYSIYNLEKMWRRVMSRELTCLMVGYGRTGPPYKVPHGSEMLRHGWGVIRNYMKCIRLMDLPLKTKGFNYVDDATWLCATPLPAHSDRVTGGDSGSPVTCDNEYVGLLSQTTLPDNVSNEKLVVIAALVYSLFENSEEYRSIMIRWYEQYPVSYPSLLPRPPLPTRHSDIDSFSQRSNAHTSPVPATFLVPVIAVSISLI